MTRRPFLTYRGVEPPLVVPFVHMKSKKEKYALWGANVADRNGGVSKTTYNMNKWSSRHDLYDPIVGRGIP